MDDGSGTASHQDAAKRTRPGRFQTPDFPGLVRVYLTCRPDARRQNQLGFGDELMEYCDCGSCGEILAMWPRRKEVLGCHANRARILRSERTDVLIY
jgi:hypothetical protein